MNDAPAPDANCWHVYLVECRDGSLYTGIARSLQQRLKAHNEGRGAKYTRSRRPVRLVWCEPHDDRSSASRREHAIKQLTRAQKLELICVQRAIASPRNADGSESSATALAAAAT